ncbi:MAG: hypothetical protein IJJ25_03700 [Lachnospiraceae bacterium]|nr:hypothetical protein [Lachnospiraceae bacterium]
MNIDRSESLFLTVSEDHTKRTLPQYIQAMSSPFFDAGGRTAAYEGIILGGADRLFGLDELNLWLRRYRYADYNMRVLLHTTHICLEYAVRTRISEERPGIPAVAELTAAELMKNDPLHWRATARNWLRILLLVRQFPDAADPKSQDIIRRFNGFNKNALQLLFDLVEGSAGCADAQTLVEQAVRLYKEIFMKYFAPDHDEDPLPEYELFDESEFEGDSDTSMCENTDERERELSVGKRSSLTDSDLLLSDTDLARIPDYIERNFGKSFKTDREMNDIELQACSGIHEGRKLLFTDGFTEEDAESASLQVRKAMQYRDANRRLLKEKESAALTGIRSIEQAFRNVLNLMSDPETYRADHGTLHIDSLWKVSRVDDPQLFYKTVKHEHPSVAIELLIDASGSQSSRQGMVALQSYMFSTALTRVGIPHRVMSYCTYGDHTVLRRFRDYDDGPGGDYRILDYHASSNNRDGLAFAAAGIDLLKRKEETKIIIVFSDGLPNDMVSGRVRPGMQKKYIGNTAVQDTCAQVRRLKRLGAQVLGIFLGEDAELDNERMIYGSSFLRIKRAEDFGGSAGRRLRDMLAQL